jgi:hypothetical protein
MPLREGGSTDTRAGPGRGAREAGAPAPPADSSTANDEFNRAVCPGCCLAQHPNLALRHCPELRIPAPLRCGREKGTPNSVVEDGCTLTKINLYHDCNCGKELMLAILSTTAEAMLIDSLVDD